MEGKDKSHGGVERGSKLKQASTPLPLPQQILHLSTLPYTHNHISNGGRTGHMGGGGLMLLKGFLMVPL